MGLTTGTTGTTGWTEARAGSKDGAVRRALDVTAAAALLVLLAPVIVIAALWVLVRAGRPVFFGHRRVGRHGGDFRCWKLRTMHDGAEAMLAEHPELERRHRENGFKLPAGSDPRVVKGLGWLRRTYLDEVPQLWNVLVGEMTLVGPRPVVRDELTHFRPREDELLSVRPGLFGPWTSLGRDRPPYPRRAEIELRYLRERSPARDLALVARGLLAVLEGQEEG